MGLAGPRFPHLADAADVIGWAQRMMARSDLARLVRSLIDQTNDQVVTLEMPTGEAAELPGYDGIVETRKGSPFVPDGRSVWELGTGSDPQAKADDDYGRRTRDPRGEIPANTTFVFVTPLRWDDKRDWIAKKKESSPWKDIVVFDVTNIETALEHAPGAHLIFSDRIGKPALGARGIEKWWLNFSSISNPPLTPEMVLAGRENDAARLMQLLESEVRHTTISATGPDEVLAFVAATILSEKEDRQLGLLGRALIVYEAHALRLLEAAAKLLILLPYDESLHREAQLLRSHHVILLAPHDAPADIRLSRIDPEKFATVLAAGGVEERRAKLLAVRASRSLVAFQREATSESVPLRPEWTSWLRSRTMRLAWLAGGWNEDRSGDLDVLVEMMGQPYDKVVHELRAAAEGEDPLFTRVGSIWGVISPEAAWDFVVRLIEPSDLHSIETAIETVFGAIDPAMDLPADQRWASPVYGKSRIHSAHLRTGLATTLAIVGAYGEALKLPGGATGQTWAEFNVRRLLRRANQDDTADLWSSLSDVIALLAEAAPDDFIAAVINGATE